MTLFKSLLLGSAAGIVAIAGASAADLPSKKAAPATYVKICDAYGAGFLYIPGTETCVKLGGYVRAEWQYVPGKTVYNTSGAVIQNSGTMDTVGTEVRGRVDVDARTPTAMGAARTFIRLRGASVTGIRNAAAASATLGFVPTAASSKDNALTVEAAMVQWAGFTFGIAPSNYAMMPSFIYNANPWAGFPNGQRQIAYTATLGGGISATLAVEDRQDWGYSGGTDVVTTSYQPTTGYKLVGNVRMDQAWGFAAIHGAVSNNSYASNALTTAASYAAPTNFQGLGAPVSYPLTGVSTKGAYAIGATVSYKLPMIAAGDQVWVSANYSSGDLGALLSAGGLSVMASASAKRINGGVVRVDTNYIETAGTTTAPTAFGNVTGWNVNAAFTHYWASQWRSNFSTGYVEITPPTSTLTTWGKGKLWEVAGSIIYSPAKDFDIGLEVQYANVKSSVQNVLSSSAFALAGSPGLSESNITTKLRVERSF